MSDIGSHDHPEYRAEQAFLRILRQPGIGMDHHGARLSSGSPSRCATTPSRTRRSSHSPAACCRPEAVQRATVLGCALRLAYTLSAGTPDLLAATRLRGRAGR